MATKRGVTAARRARAPRTPTPLAPELLDRLCYAYRFNVERRPNWSVVSVDMVDLRAVLEAHGVEIPS